MNRHLAEADLALYAGGDLPLWQSALVYLCVGMHIRQCEGCRTLVDALRADREELRRSANDMPPDVDWDQLSAEMTANIRVGLAAGECVTPREPKPAVISWRPAAIAAGVVVLLAGAWWLNIPRSDTETIGRALRNMASGERIAASPDENGPVVGAFPTGVELVENGGRLGIEQSGLQPVMFSVSAQGSASARYVDQDTGQVTITAVYVQ